MSGDVIANGQDKTAAFTSRTVCRQNTALRGAMTCLDDKKPRHSCRASGMDKLAGNTPAAGNEPAGIPASQWI